MDTGYKKTQRKARRKMLTTFCSALVEYHGDTYRAVMKDVSVRGAGFRLEVCLDEPDLRVGERIQVHIHSSYGDADLEGRIKWVDSLGAFTNWGIEFAGELDDQARSLVNRLMDSTF